MSLNFFVLGKAKQQKKIRLRQLCLSHVCASDYMKLVFREQERRNRSAQGSRDERQYGKREKQRQRKRQTEIDRDRER